MYNNKFVIEILKQILNSIKTVIRRFESIESSDDFLTSDHGLDMLDAICMQLIAIGESIKNIDKITHQELLKKYSKIDWKGVKGIRDIISHHYFDLDAEEIFNICNNNIPPLAQIISTMIEDIEKNFKDNLNIK